MSSQEFIISRLIDLFSKIKGVKIRYEFRASTLSHIVEVVPFSIFEESLEYLTYEALLEQQFEQLYPLENIVFVSDGSLTEIRKADFELGYNEIPIDYFGSHIEFEVTGYSNVVETELLKENFALAA